MDTVLIILETIFIMVKVPPFRVFVQPNGIPSSVPLLPEPSNNVSNLFLNASTFTYWYWMLSGLTIELGYTIEGDVEVPVRHQIHMDAQKILPTHRILKPFSISKDQRDDDLEIATFCWLLLDQPHYNTLPQTFFDTHKKYTDRSHQQSLLWSNATTWFPKSTPSGICFKFLEYADNRDFTIYTIPCDGQGKHIGTFNAQFVDQKVPFYISTPYPDEIAIRIDFVHIIPEFFEIESPSTP